MGTRVKHGMVALFACAFGFGASVTLQDTSSPSIASAPSPAGMVLQLTFPEAHADTIRKKRTRNLSPAQRNYDERRRKEYEKRRREEDEKKKRDIGRPNLSGDDARNCVYDSYASTSGSSDIYDCGGDNYRRYEKDGVTTYEAVKP